MLVIVYKDKIVSINTTDSFLGEIGDLMRSRLCKRKV